MINSLVFVVVGLVFFVLSAFPDDVVVSSMFSLIGMVSFIVASIWVVQDTLEEILKELKRQKETE